MKRDAKEKLILLTSFLFIPTIILLIFVLYPAFELFNLSLSQWDGYSPDKVFVGLENYKKIIFDSPEVWESLKNNGLYFVAHLILIPLEVYIAVLLDRYIKKSDFFKSIIFLPNIINVVAVAYMFSYLYSSEGGVLNNILNLIGIESISWLSDPSIVNYSLIAISIWQFTGVHVILFLAGLQSIPKDMLEAAEIDGASVYHQFTKIILPNMKTVLSLILFLNIRGALMVFEIPFVVTSGGPGTSSSTFTLTSIKAAFDYQDFGKASAMAIIMIILIFLITFIQKKIFKMEE
jgi:multiple sugar transport system permease protein